MVPNDSDQWMQAMRRGDFARAWTISDTCLRQRTAAAGHSFSAPRHLQHIWDGRSFVGKRVLVRCYHGLGDTIQFVRFLRPLRALAHEVTVWTQPCLMQLVATAEGIDHVLPLHDGTPEIDYDADVEIMELAHALRIDARDLPGPVPYLSSLRVSKIEQPADVFRVGLVWRAGAWDPRRSIPASALSPLAVIPGVELYALQHGPERYQARNIPAIEIDVGDVVTLCATLTRALDLVISVDTFIAHLAGALGVPTWLMLHADCDWRWGVSGARTHWYPTVRLFRQCKAGDWHPVIGAIAAELASQERNRAALPSRKERKYNLHVRPV